MGDIQVSGAAVTIIVAMVGALTSAIVYMFRTILSNHERQLATQRDDYQQALRDLRADYQGRLDEWVQREARSQSYLERQAEALQQQSELLRTLHRQMRGTE